MMTDPTLLASSLDEPHNLIGAFGVKDLFGRFNYTIPSVSSHEADTDLRILYGDNGAGKTTLLSLLFRLLSPADGQGHKGYVARTPFREFWVQLHNGTEVRAIRSTADVGPYTISITSPDVGTTSVNVKTSPDLGVSMTDSPELAIVLQLLRGLRLRLYLLSDDRKLRDDFIQASSPDIDFDLIVDTVTTGGERVRRARQRNIIYTSLSRATTTIKDLLLTAGDQGQVSVDAIYRDIAMTLGRSLFSEAAAQQPPEPPQAFLARLQRIHDRSAAYNTIGLTPTVVSHDLIKTIANVPADRYSQLFAVLSPYVNGIEARFEALDRAKRLVENLVGSLNDFLTDKHVAFHVKTGLTVQLKDNGRPLDPTLLSSGERQLLVLLCSAVFARQNAATFIIDEPELSLNIKWQRRLVPALLRCVEGSSVQFILATHAIPLATPFRNHVIRLGHQHEQDELF